MEEHTALRFEVSFNFDAWLIYDFIVYDIDFLFVT